jgi:hypothetical protein
MDTNPSWRELSRLAAESPWRELTAAWLIAATGLAGLCGSREQQGVSGPVAALSADCCAGTGN